MATQSIALSTLQTLVATQSTAIAEQSTRITQVRATTTVQYRTRMYNSRTCGLPFANYINPRSRHFQIGTLDLGLTYCWPCPIRRCALVLALD